MDVAPSISELAERLTACRAEIVRLKASVSERRAQLNTGSLSSTPSYYRKRLLRPDSVKVLRRLGGHFGKVFASVWAPEGQLLTAGYVRV